MQETSLEHIKHPVRDRWSGRAVKRLRVDASKATGREWTQEILANALEVSVQTVASWERDLREISTEMLQRLDWVKRCIEDAQYEWLTAAALDVSSQSDALIVRTRRERGGRIILQAGRSFNGLVLVFSSAALWEIQAFELLLGTEVTQRLGETLENRDVVLRS